MMFGWTEAEYDATSARTTDLWIRFRDLEVERAGKDDRG